MRMIGGEELRRLLPPADAVDALEVMFAAPDPSTAPPRVHAEVGEGATLLLMPASSPAGTGVKLVTVNPANPQRGEPLIHGLYVLFDPERLAPSLLVDGAALTALRTAAVSGVATRRLAREDASRLVLFGAGTQAWAHLDVMCAVRPVRQVTVVSRSREPAERLAAHARGQGLDARVGAADAVAEADLVCTCTTSPEPVFDGGLLRPGVHVNAVGAFTPDTRELDDATATRGRLVVEQREAALAEAGDIVVPLEAGTIGEDAIVADLFEVCRGDAAVRTQDTDVTVFKSVGLALEDLAVVTALAQRV
jgi:ornithine cyclodeaminase/alanine dehydrogenase-like protein (mu-crystallin family)